MNLLLSPFLGNWVSISMRASITPVCKLCEILVHQLNSSYTYVWLVILCCYHNLFVSSLLQLYQSFYFVILFCYTHALQCIDPQRRGFIFILCIIRSSIFLYLVLYANTWTKFFTFLCQIRLLLMFILL